MSGKKPVGNAWGGALKVVLNDIDPLFLRSGHDQVTMFL